MKSTDNLIFNRKDNKKSIKKRQRREQLDSKETLEHNLNKILLLHKLTVVVALEATWVRIPLHNVRICIYT